MDWRYQRDRQHERLDFDLIERYQYSNVKRYPDCTEIVENHQNRLVTRRWVRVRRLGRGNFGNVWLEKESGNNKREEAVRALKEIEIERLNSYQHEVGALAKFSKYSQYFTDFYGWYIHDHFACLVQEYFPCGDLSKCIRSSLSEHEAVQITGQLAKGLQIMHESCFTHRDLKPQNVFVVSASPKWFVKIGDFGCVKRVQSEWSMMNTIAGTRAYQAPEMYQYVESATEYHDAVDVWSLGCITFEVLCGEMPFEGELSVLKSFCDGKSGFPFSKLERKNVSQTGIKFVNQLLGKNPNTRPSAKDALTLSWLQQVDTAMETSNASTVWPLTAQTAVTPLSLRTSGKTTAYAGHNEDDWIGPLGLNLLHSPPESLVDLVLVHGVGGGSRKTWSKTQSLTHFWPQEWLPKEQSIRNMRIHSFGYETEWAEGRYNCMDIHHFGKSLLGEMSESPFFCNADTPILLMGHSIGGLIIKKAYVLAQQITMHTALAQRFHTLYFVATPHRGFNSTKLLCDIIQATHSSHAEISAVIQDFGALKAINDEFWRYCNDLDLWSFYETQKVEKGPISNKLVVEPDAATLGCHTEKQIPINADHSSICKFDTPADANYVIFRNALASTMEDAFKSSASMASASLLNIHRQPMFSVPKEDLPYRQIKDLEKYLRVPRGLEDDLISLQDARTPGTCEWFLNKQNFLDWKSFVPNTPSILWVNGKPAAGKSVLAACIIEQLQNSNAKCSYFFFKHGDESKLRLSACLRSLAFQMACTDVHVQGALLEMQREDIEVDNDNEHALWRKLFSARILKMGFGPTYWVIDGLDECVSFGPFFDKILVDLNMCTQLRLLITSRNTSDLKKHFDILGADRSRIERIKTVDTLPDIKLLVEAQATSFSVKDQDRDALIEKILRKSQGSFLWTALVLNELSKSHGEQEISQVLDEVPRDMEPLYQRTLELMSQATRGKKFAKATLAWTMCTMRPLTTQELGKALLLDIQDTFPKLNESITALCGQLVIVDRFDKVQIVHETAKEFLLKSDLKSEFAINQTEAHTQIARACLTYLTGEEMRPPRTSKTNSTKVVARRRDDFSAYACSAFSYHLSKASPHSNDALVLVNEFLKANVLSWIEAIAQTRDIVPLIHTGRDLKRYFDLCVVEGSPLSKEMQILGGWATDLIRIAARFANALIALPRAIYSLILPLCPTDSTVYRTVRTGRKLSLVGPKITQWDDRLSHITFHESQATALVHGEEYLAVGLSIGTVILYHARSCQELKTLNHGETVKFLQIKSKTALLASSGLKNIRVWDIHSGETIHRFQIQQRPIGLLFDKNLLMVASYQNCLLSWDLDNDGCELPKRYWSSSEECVDKSSGRPPSAVSISVSQNMLAAAYSQSPIALWDLEEDEYYGSCGMKLANGETTVHPVTALVFNPNPNIGLLAASYLDGKLVVLDPFQDKELKSFRAHCHTLAASPNGHLLAGAAGYGTICIYEFETLKQLYRVRSTNLHIKQLDFSRDGLRVSDIRGSQCNVWEPAVVLRSLVSDKSSEGSTSSVIETAASDTPVKILSMTLHPSGNVAFCGKNDGSVSVYDFEKGTQLQTLYRHDSSVRILTWWPQSNIIMSADVSNRIFGWSLKKISRGGWLAENMRFQSRLDCGRSIVQLLSGEKTGKFILSTRESDHLWSIDGSQIYERMRSDRSGICKWVQHQESQLYAVCIEDAAARIYSWSDFSEVASVSFTTGLKGLELKNVFPCIVHKRTQILLELSELNGSASTRGLQLYDMTSWSIDMEIKRLAIPGESKAEDFNMTQTEQKSAGEAISIPLVITQLANIARHVTHVITLTDTGTLIFLDSHSWVCSMSIESTNRSPTTYLRHFFVPNDWFSGTRDIICKISQRDVLFARNDAVMSFKGGLDYIEKVTI